MGSGGFNLLPAGDCKNITVMKKQRQAGGKPLLTSTNNEMSAAL